MHRSLVLSGNEILGPQDFAWITGSDDLPPLAEAGAAGPSIPRDLGDGGYQRAIDQFDRLLLLEALEQTGGKIREAARLLGIARNTLKAKIQKLDIDLQRTG